MTVWMATGIQLSILRIILPYRRNVVNVTINKPKSFSLRLMKKDIVC